MPGNIINLTPADIAAWPTPNYDNPPRRTWAPEYACILLGAATVTLFTRLWLRYKKFSGGLGLDDAVLIAGWLGTVWFTVLFVLAAQKYMIDRHMWDIPLTEIVSTARVTWISELAFVLAGCCIRVSVLLFYRRLVERTYTKYWLWALYFAMGFTVAYTLALVLMLVFNCTPTEAYWEAFSFTYNKKYHCADTQVINLLAGIFAIISDAYSVALPCIMTMGMQMPRRQKIALQVVFCLGLVVVGISGVRTYWLHQVGVSSDVSTCIFYVFVYSHLEICLGIICAALPSLRVLFREYLRNSRFTRKVTELKNTVLSSRNKLGKADAYAERGPVRRLDSSQDINLSYVKGKQMSSSSDRSEQQDVLEAKVETTIEQTWEEAGNPPVTTPEDYEAYNQFNIGHFRRASESQGAPGKGRSG